MRFNCLRNFLVTENQETFELENFTLNIITTSQIKTIALII